MKIVGLIAEYDPFHNGHLYHIQKALEITGSDAAVVVMSGDYVQRGLPASMPKRLRAEMALRCGAAAVFELPLCYSTGSAELFALGAVSLLQQLGSVSALCFGSECGRLSPLADAADVLCREPEGYRRILKEHLKKGASFPAARQAALRGYSGEEAASRLRGSNDILGIEYLKALKRLNSTIVPFTIERRGPHEHDKTIAPSYSSASALRNVLDPAGSTYKTPTGDPPCFDELFPVLADNIPEDCLPLLRQSYQVCYPVNENDFSLLLRYRLLSSSHEGLLSCMDVSEELANRITGQLSRFLCYRQFRTLLKTRELTQTRINRALLHIMLGVGRDEPKELAENGHHHYARLIGSRRDAGPVLSAISKNSNIPLLTRMQDAQSLSEKGRRMLRRDIFASDLYRSVLTEKFKTPFAGEAQQGILKIPS